jgi:hypothetical protein
MSNRKKIKKNKRHQKRGLPVGIKRVAIVGKGEGRGLAPRAGTPGVEVWGTNNVGLQQKIDMIWDMHNLDWTIEENRANYKHLADRLTPEEIEQRVRLRDAGFKKLKEHCIETGTPIMSVKTYAGLPVSHEYPLQKIIEKFDCDLFTSVVPYMIAYAIFKKYTHIDIYGINCAYHEEWAYQREAVWGWAERARGHGLKVTFTGGPMRPGRSFDNNLYGYNTPQAVRGVQKTDRWWEPKDQQYAAIHGIDMNDKNSLIERVFDDVYYEGP